MFLRQTAAKNFRGTEGEKETQFPWRDKHR